MIYLLIGQDSLSKDSKLKKIRQEFITKDTEQFNLDSLYGKELALRDLQERLLSLPVKTKNRIIVIREAEYLKQEIKDFIVKYIQCPSKEIILVLDMSEPKAGDDFLRKISRCAQVLRFHDTKALDAFGLSRQIDSKRPESALRLLSQLLENGSKPEMILGALRYSWDKDALSPLEKKRRIKLLFNCDREIKTGRLKPVFALEKLVLSLCCFGKPLS